MEISHIGVLQRGLNGMNRSLHGHSGPSGTCTMSLLPQIRIFHPFMYINVKQPQLKGLGEVNGGCLSLSETYILLLCSIIVHLLTVLSFQKAHGWCI